MTDAEALLKASVRERRRLSAMFTILIVAFVAVLGTAWLVERGRGDSWRDQALQAQEQSTQWQDEYISLYDEFTASTGEEPEAPEPSDVAEKTDPAPESEPGAQGPVGPAGVAGKPGKDGRDGLPGAAGLSATEEQIAAAVAEYCADGRCVGPAGTNGTNGVNGTNGADSTVPGPAGAPGAPGPTCPDGFTPTLAWVPVADSELDIPTQRQAIVCLPIQNTPEGVAP